MASFFCFIFLWKPGQEKFKANEASQVLALGPKFSGYQKNSVTKMNHILMQYLKLKLMQEIWDEQNIKNLHKNTISIIDFFLLPEAPIGLGIDSATDSGTLFSPTVRRLTGFFTPVVSRDSSEKVSKHWYLSASNLFPSSSLCVLTSFYSL